MTGLNTSCVVIRRAPDIGPSCSHGTFPYLLEPTSRYWSTTCKLSPVVLTSNLEDFPSPVPSTTTYMGIIYSLLLTAYKR